MQDPLTMFADRLPEGALPDAFVGVISYLDPQGGMAYCVVHASNSQVPMSSFVGLLELGKLKVVEYFESGGD